MQNIQILFKQYKENWLRETEFTSNMTEIINNYYYQKIIELGEEVTPLIIQDLKCEENHWFYALEKLTDINTAEEHKGNFNLMKLSWLNWYDRISDY